VEKYCKHGQDTDEHITWRMRIACWITKATDTLRICNSYFFCTATIVALILLNITVYVATSLVLWSDKPGATQYKP